MTGGDLLSPAPLQHDCCEELGVAFNLTGLSLEISQRYVVPHLDDLRYASKKVSDLEKETAEQEKLNQHFIRHHVYSIAIYVIASIILIYAIYKLFMFVRKYCYVFPCVRTETNKLSKMLPPPEVNGQGNTVNTNINTSNEAWLWCWTTPKQPPKVLGGPYDLAHLNHIIKQVRVLA